MSGQPRIAVIGAGVIGVSTALHLLEEHQKFDVTIISDRDFKDTTSWGPPGFFRMMNVDEQRKKWAAVTLEHFNKLYWSSDGADTGIKQVSAFILDKNRKSLEQMLHAATDILNLRLLEPRELQRFQLQGHRQGVFITTFASEGKVYVPWMTQRLRNLGCKFLHKRVDSFKELSETFDLVINCTGLGATHLTDDPLLQPQRGVLIEVDAPWVKHSYYDLPSTYIILGSKSAFLGGLRQMGRFDLTVTEKDRSDIWSRCTELLPNIQKATVINEWAGLRPYRPTPRVEKELVFLDETSKPLPVIHNYGHGGSGFILSWGCAKEVAEIIREHLRQGKSKL